ncbi:MAG: transcriptional regulator, partial [Bacteroidetes bacterium 4572_114]
EPSIPFPQSDSFERVINLCELLNENSLLNREDLTDNYDFNVRQTNYYTDAGRYLGLIDKSRENGEVSYFLSEKGQNLFGLSIIERQLKLIELILSHFVFNKVLKLYFKKAEAPNSHEIVQLMKESNLYNINSDITFYRRSSTILSWINWVLEQVEE